MIRPSMRSAAGRKKIVEDKSAKLFDDVLMNIDKASRGPCAKRLSHLVEASRLYGQYETLRGDVLRTKRRPADFATLEKSFLKACTTDQATLPGISGARRRR